MNSFPLEILFGEKALCTTVNREELFQLIAAGAKIKFPKSVLSLYKIIPRVMTRYPMKQISTSVVTGIVITTVYNLKKNSGIPVTDKISKEHIEKYYLSNDFEVLSLMIDNTSISDLSYKSKKFKSNKSKNPVIFMSISTPVVIVMSSKKQISTYVQDKQSNPNSEYLNINPGIAVYEAYGNTYLLDIHNPSSVLTVSAIYGIDSNMELKKLSTNAELESYQDTTIEKAMHLKTFIELFETIKKHIRLSSYDV